VSIIRAEALNSRPASMDLSALLFRRPERIMLAIRPV
jgi:hypothetical protein